MIFIRDYNRYLKEQTTTDGGMDKTKKNTREQYKDWLDDFNKQKNDLFNIFNNKSLDDPKSPETILSPQRKNSLKKYLKDGDVNQMVYNNDLLKIWAEICYLNRRIQNLDQKIQNQKTDVDKSKTSDDKLQKDNSDLMSKMVQNFEKERQNIELQIRNKETEKNNKMKQYQTEIKKISTDLNKG